MQKRYCPNSCFSFVEVIKQGDSFKHEFYIDQGGNTSAYHRIGDALFLPYVMIKCPKCGSYLYQETTLWENKTPEEIYEDILRVLDIPEKKRKELLEGLWKNKEEH